MTILDAVCASTFIATCEPSKAPANTVPVVCGPSGVTILPLLSRAEPAPPSSASQTDIEGLTNRIQSSGGEVVKAKDGVGSATFSMAYAAAEFTNIVLNGLKGGDGPWGLFMPGDFRRVTILLLVRGSLTSRQAGIAHSSLGFDDARFDLP
ncbi:hypothetical protein FS749_010531 [Ceratobasidium sp. UAMH 11750]|nr:hypothetical protein FS749_010531 [Ceratobasidium sp. UAMH 11750]